MVFAPNIIGTEIRSILLSHFLGYTGVRRVRSFQSPRLHWRVVDRRRNFTSIRFSDRGTAVRHRSAAGLFAKSAHGRLRLADELPAVPAEPRRARVDRRRQHDFRSRQAGILQCGKPVPIPLVEAQGTRREHRLAKRRANGRDAIFPGEPDTQQLPAAGRIFLSLRAPGTWVEFHRLSARRAL